MKPTILRAEATTDDGRLMTLHEHDGDSAISVTGVSLMSTRQDHSELVDRQPVPFAVGLLAFVLLGSNRGKRHARR